MLGMATLSTPMFSETVSAPSSTPNVGHQCEAPCPCCMMLHSSQSQRRQKGFDKLHVCCTVPVEDVVVSSLVENVQRLRFWRCSIQHVCVPHVHQFIIPGMQDE